MRNVLLATLLVLLFASSANAGLFGRQRQNNNDQYITKGDVARMMMMERIRDNTEAIRDNTTRIQAIEDQILQARMEHMRETLKAEISSRIQEQIVPPTTQPTVIYETTKPVYQRIETLPPVRRVVQPTYRVQQVRQVR